MEFREVLRRRRMVREFEQRSVPREVVDRLLDAARRAPTAGFAQGVDFVVLDTPEAVARFSCGEKELRDELGVPEDRNLIAIVGLGYADPAERQKGSGATRPRRPFEDQVHRGRW